MSTITSTGPRPDPQLPPRPVGPDHFREAEELLEVAAEAPAGSAHEKYHLAAAQVHATLALAAATVQSDTGPCGRGGGKDWNEAVTRPEVHR